MFTYKLYTPDMLCFFKIMNCLLSIESSIIATNFIQFQKAGGRCRKKDDGDIFDECHRPYAIAAFRNDCARRYGVS